MMSRLGVIKGDWLISPCVCVQQINIEDDVYLSYISFSVFNVENASVSENHGLNYISLLTLLEQVCVA